MHVRAGGQQFPEPALRHRPPADHHDPAVGEFEADEIVLFGVVA
jgi:hypothetical protein